MPPALLSRQEVIERLMLVVRRRGYDGASLTELSKATGLGKSSLYHYFPAGKDDMVRTVLQHLESRLRDLVFTPLRTPGVARRRIEGMVKTLEAHPDWGAMHGLSPAVLASARQARPTDAKTTALLTLAVAINQSRGHIADATLGRGARGGAHRRRNRRGGGGCRPQRVHQLPQQRGRDDDRIPRSLPYAAA